MTRRLERMHRHERRRRSTDARADETAAPTVRSGGPRSRAARAAGPSRRRRRPDRDASSSTSSTERTQALYDVSLADPREVGDGLHRPVRLRQVHVPPLPEPDERHHPGHARRGRGPARRRRHLRAPASTSSTCGAGSEWCSRSRTRFPKSIFDNVAYGLRINGIGRRSELPERVEKALRRAALWDEVKDRLRHVRARRSRAASSSGSASRARSPSSRRSS